MTWRFLYTLRVVVPDEIDADTQAEIDEDASEHDTTTRAKVSRWLGGPVSDAAGQLSAWLPEGWTARVGEVRLP